MILGPFYFDTILMKTMRSNFFIITLCFAVFVFNRAEDAMVFLITGCSSGIGRATALALASYNSNFKVYATMRKPSDWNEPLLPNLGVIPMDVTSEKSVKEAVDVIIQNERKIDVVINNAGIGMLGTLELVKIDDAKKLFDVNVWGPVRVLQAVLPYMRHARKGYVINLSSSSGIRGLPAFEYYTGSKFALEGIMDSMRYSLAPFNIAVTNVNAGPVKTNLTASFNHLGNTGKNYRMVDDDTGYLKFLSGTMLDTLNRRMESNEAQTAEEIGQFIINLIVNRKHARNLNDIPFNIGTSEESQRVIELVRKQPTGWGGVYNIILSQLPQPPQASKPSASGASGKMAGEL